MNTRYLPSLEQHTQAVGRDLFAAQRKQRRNSLSEAIYAQMLKLATSDDRLKTELFRFIDVLPAMTSDHSTAQHLIEYVQQPGVKLPAVAGKALALAEKLPFGDTLIAQSAHIGARTMSQRMIAGSNVQQVVKAIERLRQSNMTFTLDLLGEAVISEKEALSYQQKYLDLIDGTAKAAARWQTNAPCDEAPFGALPRVNVSVKLSSLYARFDPMAAEATATAVKDRLRPIFDLARKNNVYVHIDMEQYAYRDISRRIFDEILMEPAYRDWADVGIVVQAYLRDSEADLLGLLKWAKERGTPVTVRLVKGAYWDYETMIAAQNGWESPVYSEKAETDANYERLTQLLIANHAHLRPAIASHNVRSVAHARAYAQLLGLAERTVEYQVLFGMGEAIGRALASVGERVRTYVPFGELLPGMAYLVRRLLENTSNDSFIRQVELDHQQEQALLVNPAEK